MTGVTAPPRAAGVARPGDDTGADLVGTRWPVFVPGVLLGCVGAGLAVAGSRAPGLERPLFLAFLLAVTATGFALAAGSRRADWWLATLVIVLAMFPNSAINLDQRIVGGGFRIFTRLVGGLLSPWDVLIGILLVLAFWMHPPRPGDPVRLLRPAGLLLSALIVVWSFGVMNGLAHAMFVRYGPTGFRSVVQQSLPIFYFAVCAVLGQRAMRDDAGPSKIMWAVRLSSVAILTQGSILLALAIQQIIPAMKGFLQIPIVLYDQLTFLSVMVSVIVARYAVGRKLAPLDWVILGGSALFLLLSTRRLILLLLIVNLLCVVILAVQRGRVLRTLFRVGWVSVVTVVVVVAIASVAVPAFLDAIALVFQSFDLVSDVGLRYAGGVRQAQLENLVRNMGDGPGLLWLTGRGLGTYWQEFVPMGLSLEVGSTAFVESLLGAGASGWWPTFHLPYITVPYRFGMVGTAVIWLVVGAWGFRWRRFIRRLEGEEKAFAVAIVVLMVFLMLAMGETLDSAGGSLYGLLLAALAHRFAGRMFARQGPVQPGASASG